MTSNERSFPPSAARAGSPTAAAAPTETGSTAAATGKATPRSGASSFARLSSDQPSKDYLARFGEGRTKTEAIRRLERDVAVFRALPQPAAVGASASW